MDKVKAGRHPGGRLTDEQRLFLLWKIHTGQCKTLADLQVYFVDKSRIGTKNCWMY